MDRVAEAAAVVAAARLAGRALAPLPQALRPRDLAEAYAVQVQVQARLGGIRSGYKIGCTTKVMQEYLGVPSPCAAGLFNVRENGAVLRFDDFRHVGVECELAVVLARDLVRGPFDAAAVRSAIAGWCAAAEIVDDRYVDWRATDAPTLIADDFFAAGAVLGAAGPLDDPRAVEGVLTINGVEAGRGRGSDIMGDPLNALAWLAATQFERGMPLRSGETVLLGSVVETRWLARGDRVRIDLTGLAPVTLGVG